MQHYSDWRHHFVYKYTTVVGYGSGVVSCVAASLSAIIMSSHNRAKLMYLDGIFLVVATVEKHFLFYALHWQVSERHFRKGSFMYTVNATEFRMHFLMLKCLNLHERITTWHSVNFWWNFNEEDCMHWCFLFFYDSQTHSVHTISCEKHIISLHHNATVSV